MPRYVIEVDLIEDDPSVVLDWMIELSNDENTSIALAKHFNVFPRTLVAGYRKREKGRFASLDEFKDENGEVIEPYDSYDEARIDIAHMAEEDLDELLTELEKEE